MKQRIYTARQLKKRQLQQIQKYQQKSMTIFNCRFHNINDKPVLDKLKSVENKTDYVRQLILADISKNKEH